MTDYPKKGAFISDEFVYDTWCYSLLATTIPTTMLPVTSSERVGKMVVSCRSGEANQVIVTNTGSDDLAASSYTANSLRLTAGDSIELIGNPANFTLASNITTVNIDIVYYLTS